MPCLGGSIDRAVSESNAKCVYSVTRENQYAESSLYSIARIILFLGRRPSCCQVSALGGSACSTFGKDKNCNHEKHSYEQTGLCTIIWTFSISA